MSFRLIYEGELLSSNASCKTAVRRNKHAIRRQLHPQLKRLWETEKTLRYYAFGPIVGKSYRSDEPPPPKDEGLQYIAVKYSRGGFGFVPTIGVGHPGQEDPNDICSLDILFLRREPPGRIVQGGDIDNRIKTLFDGLRLPQNGDDVTDPPEEHEKPMYCLLRDDQLISDVRVNTDLLLRPPKGTAKHKLNEVLLVIEVKIRPTSALWL